MKIGVDTDEVITETITSFIEFYNLARGTNLNLTVSDFYTYEWWTLLRTQEGGAVTKEDSIKVYEEFHNSKYYDALPPIPGAPEGLQKIINSPKIKNVSIITARPVTHAEKTERWLRKHLNGHAPRIHYTSGFYNHNSPSKAQTCLIHGIEVMIEDNEKYALECAEANVDVILLNKPWNQNVSHKRISRAENWAEILGILNL